MEVDPMEDTRLMEDTVVATAMARDLLSLSLDTLVMAIPATGVMEVTEVMDMEPLTDLMEVVHTDTIKIKKALHSKSSYCNTTLHCLLFTLEAF